MGANKGNRLTVEDYIEFAREDNFDEILIVGKKGNDINYYVSTNDYNGMLGALERTKINIINMIDN